MGWGDVEFVVFDLEANADRSDAPEHEIIDIGAVLVSGGTETAAFQTLVRPTRELRDFTRELTRLSDGDVASAPRPADALGALYDFVDGRPMVAHNSFGYDFRLLDSAGAKAGVAVPESVLRLDSLELAHLALPRAGKGVTASIDGSRPPQNRSLDGLAKYFFDDEPRGEHRALGDARLLSRVLPKMLGLLDGDEPARRLQRWVLSAGNHPWARFIAHEPEPIALEDVIPAPRPLRRAPATREFDIAGAVGMLDEGGKLMGRARQPREQQKQMAGVVAETLGKGGKRLIEAPTGTGKTLAYLLPAIEHARADDRPVVIAPHSKVLQDQIMSTLEELSGELEPFESVLLKGRSNYIDLEALAGEIDALAYASGGLRSNEAPARVGDERPAGQVEHASENLRPDEALALAMVCGWVAQTPTGDWDDLRAGALYAARAALSDLRRRLRAEDALGPALTPLDDLDFHRRARDGLRHTHVGVLNHALIVSDHEWRDHSKRLVLDEAHNLEDAATDALSQEASGAEILGLCDALWDARRRGGTVRRLADAARWPLGSEATDEFGVWADGGRGDSRGRLPGQPETTDEFGAWADRRHAAATDAAEDALPAEVLDRIRRCVGETRSRCERFGDALVGYLRVRTGAGAADRYPVSYRIRRGIDTRHPDYAEVLAAGKRLCEALGEVADALNGLNLPAELAVPYRRNRLEAEVSRLGHRARNAAKTIDAVLWAVDPEEQIAIGEIEHKTPVSAVGTNSGSKEEIAIGEIEHASAQADGGWTWTLKRSPVSVASHLGHIWDSLEAVVLTSATLRAGGSFSHVIDSLGLAAVEETVLGSPFAWISQNHLLLLADYLPAPRARLMEEFKASAAAEIPRLLMLTGGRGMALMTARARMEFVRDHARPILEAEGIPLLAQGDDSALALVERMRDERVTSLIAVRSFWEGVDIPGEALSLLMIEKIPFDSPADPIAGARMEAMEQRGKGPFAHYLVPRAALRFAQGAGRLIRTEHDRGVTVVLDSRLCRAVPYRDQILDTLPGPPRRVQAVVAEDAYRQIAGHLGGIELDDAMLQRLGAVEGPDAWAGLAELELSEDDLDRPEVIDERLEKVRGSDAGVGQRPEVSEVIDARLEKVRELFGFERWRPGQLETMRRFMAGSDFLAVLPTGSGKSVTFQIPALLCPGLTLVISPLKALMNDQVENLRTRGTTRVAAIHSGVGQAEGRDVLRGAEQGDYKLLYVSPERLWSQEFVETLCSIGVARIAVDEAHCISQWGHSFRPEYAAIPDAVRRIASGRQRPPILAVTATATEAVRNDVVELLGLDLSGDSVAVSPDRPEIRYFTERCRDSNDRDVRVVQIVEAFRGQAAIVYAPTRKDTTRIAGLLRAAGHTARAYHGTMDDEERRHTEDAFRHGEVDVVVTTKAFGMGIDKPDIALIVHLEMPATIEEYVQETGRAARGAAEGKGPKFGTAVLLTASWDCSIHRLFVKSAAPGIEQVRRIWFLLGEGTRAYDPKRLDRDDDSDSDGESVTVALAVHYLQEAGALRRGLDTPWRGRVSIVGDTERRLAELQGSTSSPPVRGATAQRLDELRGEDPGLGSPRARRSPPGSRLDELRDGDPELARRGRQIVELMGRLGTDEYRAERWGSELERPPVEIAADLFDLNRRDILGFTVQRHAWTLRRKPGPEPAWPVIEAEAERQRETVDRKSRQAKEFARRRSGCRVREMLEYFGAEGPESCGRCDLCTPSLARPWAGSHISRGGLLESLPKRSIVLQLLDDTSGARYSRRNLERTLVGKTGSADNALPPPLAEHHLYGRLAFHGAAAVHETIDSLIDEGLVRSEIRDYNGVTYERLEITQEGLSRHRGGG